MTGGLVSRRGDPRLLAEQLTEGGHVGEAEGGSRTEQPAPFLGIILAGGLDPVAATCGHGWRVGATAEGPKALEIGVHPIGDEARPFDRIGLPSLELGLDADDREVEERQERNG